MAASQEQIQEQFLTCSICYEIYQEPKCLPCLHTFCRHCIDSYIESLRDFGVVRKMGFPCPMCKQFLFIKGWQKPLDEWADEIKDNFMIKNLITCVSSSSLKPEEVSTKPANIPCVMYTTASAPPPEVSTNLFPIPSAPPLEEDSRMLYSINRLRRGQFHEIYSNRGDYLLNEALRTPMSWFGSQSSENLSPAEPAPHDYRFRANSASELNRNQPIVRFIPKATRWNLISDMSPFDSKVQYSDICQLNDKYESIALADYNGGRVVLFRGLYNGRIRTDREISVGGMPCSLALVGDGTDKKCLVVCLQVKKELLFLSIPKLKTLRKLKTERNYRCVTALTPFTILAGSSDRPGCIDRIDLDGSYGVVSINTLVFNVSLNSLVHLCALSHESFVVSDLWKKRISYFCIEDENYARKIFDISSTRDGKFRCPGGLCVDKDTQKVYAVDYGNNSVFRFEPEIPVLCEPLLDESNKVEKPASVCLGPKGALVVADWKGRVTMFRKQDDRR